MCDGMKSDAKIASVAIIGSGMAGLVTAYLLDRDPHRRYRVTVLEKKNELSLNSESIVISSPDDPKVEWADVPMRAIAGGFYHNLIQMYNYLGIRYRPQPFLFTFARLPSTAVGRESQVSKAPPHMIHASNFHQLPPKPLNCQFLPWIIEIAYVLLSYLWFSICCFLVAPHDDSASTYSESLDQYLRRICLPQYYTTNYLLPLMSGVCTCSHQQLLRFPASDILNYKKRTHRQQHYVVDGGVQNVQEKLSKGLNVSLGVCLTKVIPISGGIEVRWLEKCGTEKYEIFDKVILAVAPDIVGAIFEPLKCALSEVPTTIVETIAHTDSSILADMDHGKVPASGMGSGFLKSVQNLHFRSSQGNTETLHEQTSSVIVTTNPLTAYNRVKTIRSSSFTRVLRSPKSRRILNDIFGDGKSGFTPDVTKGWRNGDSGVYLAGGWCWDGMVLLEGCIVSAMRVASCLGVEIPWASRSDHDNPI